MTTEVTGDRGLFEMFVPFRLRSSDLSLHVHVLVRVR
jgi:hypothetical protein